jgi:hypothetical protein
MVTRCPRCETEALHPELAMNALSRKDNKTYVCSPCGRDEAIWDFQSLGMPHPEWPIRMNWERIR